MYQFEATKETNFDWYQANIKTNTWMEKWTLKIIEIFITFGSNFLFAFLLPSKERKKKDSCFVRNISTSNNVFRKTERDTNQSMNSENISKFYDTQLTIWNISFLLTEHLRHLCRLINVAIIVNYSWIINFIFEDWFWRTKKKRKKHKTITTIELVSISLSVKYAICNNPRN